MPAFLVRLEDSRHQAYMQKYPFLVGPDVRLNRELRTLWRENLEIRQTTAVPFTHEKLDGELDDLVCDADRAAILRTCRQLGIGEPQAKSMINSWGWKVARAPRSARRILSLGCANGGEFTVLRALFPDAELHGVDFDMVVPATWRKTLRLGELRSQPIEEYLSAHPQAFDLVFSNHTLEHLSSPDRTLRLVYSALVPGGACVSALPLEGHGSSPFYQNLLDIAERRDELDPELDLEFLNPSHAWKTNHDDVAATVHAAGFRNICLFSRVNYPSYIHGGNGAPSHISRLRRVQAFGQLLERATLRPLRRGLRWTYPAEMPWLATKVYYTIAGRCWFSRLRLLHTLMHEVLVVATAAPSEGDGMRT